MNTRDHGDFTIFFIRWNQISTSTLRTRTNNFTEELFATIQKFFLYHNIIICCNWIVRYLADQASFKWSSQATSLVINVNSGTYIFFVKIILHSYKYSNKFWTICKVFLGIISQTCNPSFPVLSSSIPVFREWIRNQIVQIVQIVFWMSFVWLHSSQRLSRKALCAMSEFLGTFWSKSPILFCFE